MFEEVCDAGFSPRFVGGTGFVPKHMGDHRCAPVGDHDHLQPIGQREVVGIVQAGRPCRRRQAYRHCNHAAGESAQSTHIGDCEHTRCSFKERHQGIDWRERAWTQPTTS